MPRKYQDALCKRPTLPHPTIKPRPTAPTTPTSNSSPPTILTTHNPQPSTARHYKSVAKMQWASTVTMSPRDSSEVRTEVSKLRQQILTEVSEIMKTDTPPTMLTDNVAALCPQLTDLSTLADSVVRQMAKLGSLTASLRPETRKQAKLLVDNVAQSIRSVIRDHYGAKYATRRVISSAQDVLDFIADNLGKDEQWRSQAAEVLRRAMEEKV